MKKKTAKRMMLFCEPCSFKLILEPEEDYGLVEIKTSPIPGGIPEYNEQDKKTVVKPGKPQNKKYKCPRCGRGVVTKEIFAPYTKLLQEMDEQKDKDRLEADRKKRLEDGKPLEKKPEFKTPPEFMG